MIRGYIFDLDGTILDSMVIWQDLGSEYLRTLQIEPEQNLSSVLSSMSLAEGAAYIRMHYLPDTTEREILKGVLKLVEHFYIHDVQLKKDAYEVLQTLKERGMGITAATAGNRLLAEAALKRLGVLGFFDAVFTCDEIGKGKDVPDIYDMAAEFMHLSCSECLVAEDSLKALLTAKNAGYTVCGVYDAYSHDDQTELKNASDLYIDAYSTLKKLL